MKLFLRFIEVISALLGGIPLFLWGASAYTKWLYALLVSFDFDEKGAALTTGIVVAALGLGSIMGAAYAFIEGGVWFRVIEYIRTGRIIGRVEQVGLSDTWRWADE